jgi:uncharacterized protein involved in exopolysaccharide biosynthesis
LEQEKQTSSLKKFLTVIFKQKDKILITFFSIVATVTLGSFLYPPIYEAKSSLLVKFGREYIYHPGVGERFSEMNPLILLNPEEIINSEIQILTSRDLSEKVITTLKVENVYPDLANPPPKMITPLEAAIQQFEKNLSVKGTKKSNVIQIAFRHKDPRIAAKAVNVLVDLFKEKHLQVYSDSPSSFLEQQLAAYEKKLKESQDNLEAFKQKYHVFSLEEQRTLLLKQRTDLDTTLKISQNQVKELQKKIFSLKSQMETVPENIFLYTDTGHQRIIGDAKIQLLNLQLREQELLQKYKEKNLFVVNVRKEIQIVQDFIKKQEEDLKGKVRTGKNVVYEDMEREVFKAGAELSSQEAKSAALKGQIVQLDREIQTLDLREKELQNLKRELMANERNYKTYLEKVEEARILDDLNRQKIANISIIQSAIVPTKPIKPRKTFNIVVGVILGVVLGVGIAFLSEYASQGLSTPESVERRLGLPVLATVENKE